jgi:hypothetical protein
MAHQRDIHGHPVIGEDDVVKGMDYLDYDLQYAEAQVIFEQAKAHGQAQFEDGQDRDYTLKHNSDGTYTLLRRNKSGGGFFSGWF